jgi:predicted TIM-barrel fold metal-dependent hydrolase
LLEDPAFRAGAAQLASRGLTFDTWLYFHQLPELARFARACPNLLIVLDHLGGPAATGRHASARAEVLTRWREAMTALSLHENVVVKLGAVGMRAFSGPELLDRAPVGSQAIADYWGAEIRFCVETFGPGRCMFESNFPVDRALCDYATLWNGFKLITADYSEDERALLFAGTARATYQLPAA